MKQIIFSVVLTCFASATPVKAQIIEFSQLGAANLGAPLPLVPRGTSYFPLNSLSPLQSTTRIWGDTLTLSMYVIPSIAFGVDDNKGISPSEMCGANFPKHIGTDYAAPAGTPVYAIADGTVKRVGGFTGVGDYYVVVESGSSQKWTTLYGHLNSPPFPSTTNGTTTIKKGALIGNLFNYRSYGDIPHLHMGIRNGAYMNVAFSNSGSSTRGFACSTDPQYQLNKYNFVSPEQFQYFTKYW
jgi:murein DD-endopeptidase MepM/ murein hydrolase activator NlpD